MLGSAVPSSHSPAAIVGTASRRLKKLSRQLRGLSTTIASPFFSDLQRRWPTPPTLASPVSQACTAGQFAEGDYARICALMREGPRLHRKQWELVYIYRSLEMVGMIGSGRRGLVFGVGREKLPALFVAQGCRIVATDQPAGRGDRHWAKVDQHANSLDKVFFAEIAGREEFYRDASFRAVDMKAIPSDLTGFDFCWSACALEHLGSLRLGFDFIESALGCLAPGGVAVHTTEFNLLSDLKTIERGRSVVYRERDLLTFAADLRRQGHSVTLNLHPGSEAADLMVDRDLDSDIHLRLYIGKKILATSIGLAIRKAI
jgi:hypothetical protein